MIFSSLFKKKSGKFHAFDFVKNKKLLVVQEPELVQQPSYPGAKEYTGLGLGFSNDCNLGIDNKYTLINGSSLKDFIGEKVIDIIYSDEAVEFVFSGNKKIKVSLKDEDWNGPEAMQLNYKGNIYIWN